jgi:hypothetical protein
MYTTEMGSDAKIYVQSFINIGSGIQKLMGNTQEDSMVIT